ncbi:MAG: REP-associated tyrosine transposase [Candidatus Acidiferrales bacterium]
MTQPKHRAQPSATYFVTTNTWQRRAVFRNNECASITEETLFLYRERGAYLIHSYAIMPDHIHTILAPGQSMSLEKSMMLIKGGSSRSIGVRFGGRLPIWQPGFTEHQIRNSADFDLHVRYIEGNPVKAKLAYNPRDYPYCSARARFPLDRWTMASGAKAQFVASVTAGLRPRPSVSANVTTPFVSISECQMLGTKGQC